MNVIDEKLRKDPTGATLTSREKKLLQSSENIHPTISNSSSAAVEDNLEVKTQTHLADGSLSTKPRHRCNVKVADDTVTSSVKSIENVKSNFQNFDELSRLNEVKSFVPNNIISNNNNCCTCNCHFQSQPLQNGTVRPPGEIGMIGMGLGLPLLPPPPHLPPPVLPISSINNKMPTVRHGGPFPAPPPPLSSAGCYSPSGLWVPFQSSRPKVATVDVACQTLSTGDIVITKLFYEEPK